MTCATPCGPAQCCEPNHCPPTYQCGPGYRQKDDMSSVICDNKNCLVHECCIPLRCSDTVAFAGCGGDFVQKPDFADRGCSGDHCTVSDCCNPICPAAYPCPGDKKPKTTRVACLTGTCTDDDCCTPKTCAADYTCPRPYITKANAASATCNPSTTCRDICCLPPAQCFAAGSGVTQCPPDTRELLLAERGECGAQCNQFDCCRRTCASYQCTNSRVLNPGASQMDCPRMSATDLGTCDDALCCQETCASKNIASPICSETQQHVMDFSTHVCDGGICRQPDCCRDTCAGWTCGNYYTRINNAQTFLCDASWQDCQSICCTENYCPPGICQVGYVPKPMGTKCLTSTCQPSECCDEEVCFGTFRCPAELGWLAKSTNPSCGGKACTKEVCCVKKTCAGYNGCLPTSLDLAHNLDMIQCASSECTDDECCIPVCDWSNPLLCPAGKRPKGTMVIECQERPCAVAECCEDRTCAGPPVFGCTGYRMTLNHNPEGIICSGDCDEATCCHRVPDYCFAKDSGVPECPLNWIRLPDDKMPNPCLGLTCEVADCCSLTCGSYNCGSRPSKSGVITCPNNVCSDELCCKPPCPGDICLSTDQAIVGMYCDGPCTRQQCCTPTCASITCPTGYKHKYGMGVPCGDSCSQDLCCEQVTCCDWICSSKWTPKPNKPEIPCPTGTCSDNICCNPNTCANYVCPPGKQNLDRTASCVQAACSDAECCTDITCTDYTCPSPYYRDMNLNSCQTNPCQPSECCRPKCTADICSANLGLHFKGTAADKMCEGMTCSSGECLNH